MWDKNRLEMMKMRYCPYCGAELQEPDILFCTECGRKLPDDSGEGRMMVPEHLTGEGEPGREGPLQDTPVESDRTERTGESDYDGYYEDVLPIDEEREREGIDRELVKKLGCVVGAVLLIVVLCMFFMYFF